MEQTAVEWVVGHLIEYGFDLSHHELEINKAKEMEKEQKGYSEEEAKKLAFDFYYDMSHKMGVPTNLISENATNVDVWFKKFKKK